MDGNSGNGQNNSYYNDWPYGAQDSTYDTQNGYGTQDSPYGTQNGSYYGDSSYGTQNGSYYGDSSYDTQNNSYYDAQNDPYYGTYGMYNPSGYDQWSTPSPHTGREKCARLSYTFGIVAICVFCTGSGLPFAIAALVLGTIGKESEINQDKAIRGRNLGIIGIVLNAVLITACLIIRLVLEG